MSGPVQKGQTKEMRYDFETLIDRRPAGAEKWNMMVRKKPEVCGDVVPLSVADMEFSIAPEIQEALMAYIQQQIPGYAGAPEGFLESVCAFLQRRHGLQVAPEELVQTPGIVYALPRAIRALTERGEGVIIMTPVYYPFYRAIANTGREVVRCPLIYDQGSYAIDFDLLKSLAEKKQNTALLFCSPHNPVGRVWTAEELQKTAQICEQYHLGLISDEIHFDLVYPEHVHVSCGALEGALARRTILCTAPSKTFNLAGMNLSNLVVRDEMLRKKLIQILRTDATPMQTPFGYVACQAAYDHGEAWLEELLAYLDENRRFVAAYFAKELPQLRAVPLEGTYLQWVDCRALGLDRQALEALMLAHDLFFDEGYLFGEEGAGFERINLACPRRVLEAALARLKNALASF